MQQRQRSMRDKLFYDKICLSKSREKKLLNSALQLIESFFKLPPSLKKHSNNIGTGTFLSGIIKRRYLIVTQIKNTGLFLFFDQKCTIN